MMQQGNLGTLLFAVLVIIIAAAALFLGASYIISANSQVKQAEAVVFRSGLLQALQANKASALRPQGSTSIEAFTLPDDADTVCFVDESREYNTLIDPELNQLIRRYEGATIFIKPTDSYLPIAAKDFTLDEGNNPLCLKATRNGIRLRMQSAPLKPIISEVNASDKRYRCSKVIGSGDEGTIGIVFLPHGYNDLDRFREDAEFYAENIFLDTEPYASSPELFTFYMVDSALELGCKVGSIITCDDFKVKRAASDCPHDFITVLAERSKVYDSLVPVRSSAKGNLQKINTADKPTVFTHEFGHIFGKLADEYVDDRYYRAIDFREEDYPNCDEAGCNEWAGLSGTSCRQGCSLSVYYRPTENSVMKNLDIKSYGPLNERIIAGKMVQSKASER